jgi:hypothetical protein
MAIKGELRWVVKRRDSVCMRRLLGVTSVFPMRTIIPDTDNARDYLAYIVVYGLPSPSVVL